jgi:hypothetical protein
MFSFWTLHRSGAGVPTQVVAQFGDRLVEQVLQGCVLVVEPVLVRRQSQREADLTNRPRNRYNKLGKVRSKVVEPVAASWVAVDSSATDFSFRVPVASARTSGVYSVRASGHSCSCRSSQS